MIKIYSNKCIKCGTLKQWIDANWIEGLEVEYKEVLDFSEQEALLKAHDTISFPVVLKDDELISFDECMGIFKENRKKQKAK